MYAIIVYSCSIYIFRSLSLFLGCIVCKCNKSSVKIVKLGTLCDHMLLCTLWVTVIVLFAGVAYLN